MDPLEGIDTGTGADPIEPVDDTTLTDPTSQPVTPPNYFTRDEVLNLLETQKRDLQSLVDKNVSRVDSRVQTALATAQQAIELYASSGIQLTDAQKQAIQTNAINKAFLTPQEQAPQQAAPKPQQRQSPEPSTQAYDPVSMTAQLMVDRAGITFEPGDPEVRLINTNAANPEDYLASVGKAIAAKKARITRVPSPAGAPGPMGKGQGSGKLSVEALTAQLEELNKHPSAANLAETRKVQEQLAAALKANQQH